MSRNWNFTMHHVFAFFAVLMGLATQDPARSHGPSIYVSLPQDPAAVVLSRDAFGVQADGVGDDTSALQRAIDAAEPGGGIVFVPSGTYRLSDTVYVWPGVRLIGVGSTRPVFKLARETIGFTSGPDKYMIYFSGGRNREPGGPPRDANPGTFYSGMRNIDVDIEPGNVSAVGVRFHVAQHCSLAHMTLNLSDARAGFVDIGNLVEDVRFIGGEIAIDTGRSSPGWPMVVMDCVFEGQRQAAIRTREAGLAVIRPQVRDTPSAVVMEEDVPDQLWISDARFERLSGPAVVVSRPENARTQVGMRNIVCVDVPALARFRGTGNQTPGAGDTYIVNHFTHGLHLGLEDSPRQIRTLVDAHGVDSPPPLVQSDIAHLPPRSEWVDVRSLGVLGDGIADDTDALRKAIDTHDVLYFPMGWYNVSDTLTLKPSTVLIGLHPARTVINLPNGMPAFASEGQSRSVIESPPNGTNIVTGLGIYTGEDNPRAVALKWHAGAASLIDDVRLHGGHGTRFQDRQVPRQGVREHWNTQPASLWIADGGGGIIKNVWTPNPHARSGLLITNTSTPGRLYVMSAEHHVDHEVVLDNVQNWSFYALQFEEEREESPRALPLLIEDSSALLFANTFFYRVISSYVPGPRAIEVRGSNAIQFRNTHVYSNSKVSFDSSVRDVDRSVDVRDPEFTVLDLPSRSNPVLPATVPAAQVRKLADGFLNIAGAAAAPNGDVYFTDGRRNRVYRWSQSAQRLELVREIPERPEQLIVDDSGNLLVVAYEGAGTVLAFDPAIPGSPMQRISPAEASPPTGTASIHPVSHWADDEALRSTATARADAWYISPDGSIGLPASEAFATGATSWGVKHDALLRTFQLARATPGQTFYVTNELELRTHAFDVEPDGSLSNPRLFVEEGGESVITDGDGNVYIAAGQIMVFNPRGERIGVIHVPSRPTSMVFGGPNGTTLYITARDAIYAVDLAPSDE